MVGAGGIGCELLKNIVLTGFAEVHIVDLDTVDLSNLNRQFLFRQEHIKKSKALVCFPLQFSNSIDQISEKTRRGLMTAVTLTSGCERCRREIQPQRQDCGPSRQYQRRQFYRFLVQTIRHRLQRIG